MKIVTKNNAGTCCTKRKVKSEANNAVKQPRKVRTLHFSFSTFSEKVKSEKCEVCTICTLQFTFVQQAQGSQKYNKCK